MPCHDSENRISLYLAGELEPGERAELERHCAACPDCAAALDAERRLLAVMGSGGPQEVSTALLAECRSTLAERLDAIEEQRSVGLRMLDWLRPTRWLVLHPAAGGVALVVLGVALGQWLPPQPRDSAAGLSAGPAVTVSALSDHALRDVNISGIQWLPGGAGGRELPSIELSLMTETPVVMRGTLDNSDVRRVLMFVVENNQRFDPGVRLDSVELLRARGDDAEVRRALAFAARHDRNPAVRLKAVEALRGFEQEEEVRKALFDALLNDDNPGVRIEAINALRALVEREPAAAPDDALRRVLEDRMQRDPNTYIRMQSAAAIRQISARDSH